MMGYSFSRQIRKKFETKYEYKNYILNTQNEIGNDILDTQYKIGNDILGRRE